MCSIVTLTFIFIFYNYEQSFVLEYSLLHYFLDEKEKGEGNSKLANPLVKELAKVDDT